MGNAAILILPHFYGIEQERSPFLVYKQERSLFILSIFSGAIAVQNLERKGAISSLLFPIAIAVILVFSLFPLEHQLKKEHRS